MNPHFSALLTEGYEGLCSACTASAPAIEAVLRLAQAHGAPALVETTANQVNQFGGYTGMQAADFVCFVHEIADKIGFDKQKILLGGDHLGPLVWRGEEEKPAMEKAAQLVGSYVRAGFQKIHIDTSMRLACDDPEKPLADETIARRGAALLAVAEQAAAEAGQRPVYVIGSEVPVPGGTKEEESLQVTAPEVAQKTVACFKEEVAKAGVASAWERVVGLVVQPGAEFSGEDVHVFCPGEAKALMAALPRMPGLVYEGHSTDYQPRSALRAMVQGGVRILKVGPALTYYQQSALRLLERIEAALGGPGDGFSAALEAAMLENPKDWAPYYSGSESEQKRQRLYSLSDRSRYYLGQPMVQNAVDTLYKNLQGRMSLALLQQFFPEQAQRVLEGSLENSPHALVVDYIGGCVRDYLYATAAETR